MCSVFVCDLCVAWYVCTVCIYYDVYGVMCGMSVIRQVCMVWYVYMCGVVYDLYASWYVV